MNVIVLQAMLDKEQEEMVSAARRPEPRNSDSFDFANYHPINEVGAHSQCYPLKALITRATIIKLYLFNCLF